MYQTISFRAFIWIIVIATALTACHWNREEVEVTYKNFGEEILEKQHLRFSFSHDLVTPDLVTEEWSEEIYASIEPKVSGKFKWVLQNELLFSPDSGFAPATSYQIKLTDKLLKDMPHADKYALGPMTFTCRTPDLQLLQAKPFWAIDAAHQAELRLELDFNYPVSISTLLPRLAVAMGSVPFTYTLLTQEASKIIEIALHTDSLSNLDHQLLKVHIDPGVNLASNTPKASAELFLETEIPARTAFRIYKAEAQYLGVSPRIEITASQAIGSDNIQSFVTVSPSVNFRIEKKSNGFILEGDFQAGETYQVNIDKRLQGVFNIPLSNDFQQTVAFATPEPSIYFPESEGLYLTSRGKRRLGVRIVGMDKVKLSIYKVYENNLKQFMSDNYLYSYIDREEYSGLYNTGDLVLTTVLETKDLQESNGLKLISLNFKDKNDYQGLYVVSLASVDDRWVQNSKLVAVSDIGLIVKQAKDELWVFANSILTAEPITGANITFVSSNNQEVHVLPTNAKGFVKLPLKDYESKGFRIDMITAQRGGDFTYMMFDQNRHSTRNKYDLTGYTPNITGLQAFVHAERNLYRPGEKAHFNLMVRDENWENPGEIPLKIVVKNPSYDDFFTMRKTLGKGGSVEGSIEFPSSAPTGTYSIMVYSAHNIELGNYELSVEEFMPDRIKVLAKLDSGKAYLGKPTLFAGTAINLFGPPASNRPYELDIHLEPKVFAPKGLDDYDFRMETEISYFSSIFLKGNTDDVGKVAQSFTIPEQYAYNGLISGKASLAVFDESSRPVYAGVSFEVATQPVFYGIKKMESYVNGNQPITIPIIATNPEGKVFKEKKAHIEVIRYEWQNVLEQSYGGLRYVSHKEEVKVADHEITIKGYDYQYQLIPDMSGSYELRVSEPGSASYAVAKFYVYQGAGGLANSFGIDKSGDITITANKAQYHVGEKAQIMFKMPFKGKLLVTVERENVLKQYEFISTKERAEAFEIPITEDMAPNAYITATLIKPVTDDAIPLTAAYGFHALKVEKPNTRLNMAITAEETSRSRQRQTVKVKLDQPQAGVEIALSVVDEGIHQIKGYQNPKPYDYFYQARALGVYSYDLYPRLLPEYRISDRNYGADYGGDDEMARRMNPLANKRVKPVSFWSGTLLTDAKGEVSYSFDIPAFSGQLRIVAVAAKGQAFGTSASSIRVADPIVVSTGLPRFASPNDEVQIPVMLANTTDKKMEVKTTIKVSGAMGVMGVNSKTTTLEANAQQTVYFNAKAAQTIGLANIEVQANAQGEVFAQTTELSVRPATSLLKSSGAGIIKGNSEQKIDLKQSYLQQGIKGSLLLSRSPSASIAPHLKYLLEYPHGCLEQTISTVFPQLYLADLSKLLQQKNGVNQQQIDYHVQQAIQKIAGLQHYSGGFQYWPNGGVSWWSSVYATHFLVEAKKAGYAVPEALLGNALYYLAERANRKEMKRLSSAVNADEQVYRETAYSLYVLALAGKPEVSSMNYVRSQLPKLTIDGQYLLACAYLLAGDQKQYQALLPATFEDNSTEISFSGDFSSPIRNMALSLNSLIDAKNQNPQIPLMAKRLSDALGTTTYLSTQERAFAVMALGKLAQEQANTSVTASIQADGKEVAQYQTGELSLSANVVGKQLLIKTQGTGDLYYFWELEGLNETGQYLEEDQGLKVRRNFFDRNGKKIDPSSLLQHDLIVVQIALQSEQIYVENVAVTDMLPAGWEIENSRIREVPGMDWIKDAAIADYIDYRDDRVHFFTTAGPTESYYYYIARAVSKGNFQMGPVSADAMYNGYYHSYHGAKKIGVK